MIWSWLIVASGNASAVNVAWLRKHGGPWREIWGSNVRPWRIYLLLPLLLQQPLFTTVVTAVTAPNASATLLQGCRTIWVLRSEFDYPLNCTSSAFYWRPSTLRERRSTLRQMEVTSWLEQYLGPYIGPYSVHTRSILGPCLVHTWSILLLSLYT